MASAYRRFAHPNPVTYSLMFARRRARRDGTVRALLCHLPARVAELAGPDHALPAARLIVAWAHGFITMELAGAFLLGGDVEQAWDFGLDRIFDGVPDADESAD